MSRLLCYTLHEIGGEAREKLFDKNSDLKNWFKNHYKNDREKLYSEVDKFLKDFEKESKEADLQATIDIFIRQSEALYTLGDAQKAFIKTIVESKFQSHYDRLAKKREAEAERLAALAKLTDRERKILGV